MRAAGKLLLGSVLGAASLAPAQLPAQPFEVGRPFPDIVLPSADDGTPMSIADFRGKRLVLHVFASW
jgi:hypothetical protein